MTFEPNKTIKEIGITENEVVFLLEPDEDDIEDGFKKGDALKYTGKYNGRLYSFKRISDEQFGNFYLSQLSYHTPEKTWDNLEIGDVVIIQHKPYLEIKVTDVGKLGFVNNGISYYTFREAEQRGYTIKQPKKQHTHKELEEKLGYEFNIIN